MTATLPRTDRPATDQPVDAAFADRLAAVIARAAHATDRLDADLFEPAGTDPAELTRRTERWWRAATGGRTAPSPARRAALANSLQDVRLRDASRLPGWAVALRTFLLAQPAATGDHGVAESMRAGAVALLPWRGAVLAGVEFTPEGAAALHEQLVRRLLTFTEPARRFQQHLDGAVAGSGAEHRLEGGVDGWLARFEALPGLAYVVGVTCEQWRTATVEFAGRLHADLPLLRHTLWGGGDPGPVSDFTGDAGDRHDDGRAVAVLRFRSGFGAVYKPKDLASAAAFQQLVTHLNTRRPGLDLPVRTVVTRGGYGWEELVASAPCRTTTGFPRFYRRLGGLIRLVQLLEGRDLWADNLIAAGEYPVLVDLECLVYPRLRFPDHTGGPARELFEELEGTVVRTSMPVQPWRSRGGAPVRDVGCLTRAGDPTTWPAGVTEPPLPLPAYLPWVSVADGDRFADPHRSFADVIDGYQAMHRLLVAEHATLAAPDGPLAAFRGAPVRYIWRNTHDCQRLILTSVQPAALLDGVAREIVLAGVLRGVAELPDRPDLRQVVEAEVDGFRRLDVPMFRSSTTSDAAYTCAGTPIRQHFTGTGWQRLLNRAAGLPVFDLTAHTDVLRSCLDAAAGGTPTVADRVATGRRNRRRSATRPDADQLVAAAADVATVIVRAAIPAGHDRVGWIGQYWQPATDLRGVDLLAVDLLGGTAAIGLFLARTAALTGVERHRTVADAVLADLVERVIRDGGVGAHDTSLTGGPRVAGGLAGPGALAYILYRAGTALQAPDLLRMAHTAALAVPAVGPVDAVGLPFGAAGLALDLLPLHTHPSPAGSGAVTGLIVDAGRRCLAALDATAGAGPEPAERALAAFLPTGRDSAAMALARLLGTDTALLDDPESARNSLRNHVFDDSIAGGRLAAAVTAAAIGELAPPVSDRGSAADPAGLGSRALLTAATEALVAADHTGTDRLLGELLRRRATTGRWLPDRLAADHHLLSALDGLVGVGNVLLAAALPPTGSAELPLLLS